MDRKESTRSINLELLMEIMEYQFGVVETTLYLNTHPRDERVLDLHNEFARGLQDLERQYQEEYGPLYAAYPMADYPWAYIDEPWPWQINY
ncbi:spore coat protein CotJB [Halothermothrix orenii]|uniref:Spore coat protein CotJB n=1 Tax=Halothermothrix orenii (strain H 168 / OCM 544 / DSM 9562) TaxID=373903 RepID=B8D197_HALOH|nr:spore coat protein CotJB [Halothermothrix orenii]ACL71049.1 spore coat protein CotJB [Halothermothrix orenii H 168]